MNATAGAALYQGTMGANQYLNQRHYQIVNQGATGIHRVASKESLSRQAVGGNAQYSN
jgi:hypothetical protein